MTAPTALPRTAAIVEDRILFVDDDPRLLDGIRRRLRNRFAIETAVGPERGLEVLASSSPFAVVVADMNMPGMDGATFLGEVRARYPDTVRMMLTGNADLGTAVAAVNSGSVYRFMQKPVPNEELERFLEAGLEKRRLGAATRRAAAAEEASRAKSQFLATVSHELRTPLTVIRSSVELLEQFGEDESPEVRAGFTATIDRFARQLETMIDQLLHTAELDAHEHEVLGGEPFNLVAAVRAAIARTVEATGGKCLYPVITAAPKVARCRGEIEPIERALAQLLRNACDASPAHVPVEVTVACAEASVTVDIIDRGPGISAAIADRVFEPFVQCVDVLNDKPPGLGLGLTIAQRIVRRHGGEITFHRDAAAQTHFVVTLPMAADPESEA